MMPFSNGTEFMFFLEENCEKCFKNEACPILTQLYSGELTKELSDRLGNPHEERCKEFATEQDIKQEEIKEYSKHQNDMFGEQEK